MASALSHFVVPVAIGAVAIVLLLGLVNMMRGGSPNTSQQLMRMRVLLQFSRDHRRDGHDLDDGALTAMVVLNRIYTRTGDDGTTSLGNNQRRKKYDLRIEAYGTLDEVNATIGLARLHTTHDEVLDAQLARIQNDLFDVEADLPSPRKVRAVRG